MDKNTESTKIGLDKLFDIAYGNVTFLITGVEPELKEKFFALPVDIRDLLLAMNFDHSKESYWFAFCQYVSEANREKIYNTALNNKIHMNAPTAPYAVYYAYHACLGVEDALGHEAIPNSWYSDLDWVIDITERSVRIDKNTYYGEGCERCKLSEWARKAKEWLVSTGYVRKSPEA